MNNSIRSVDASNQIAFQGWWRRKEIAQAITRTAVREAATASPAVATYLATGNAGKSLAIGVVSKVVIDTVGAVRSYRPETLSLLNIWQLGGKIISGVRNSRWI